MKPRSVLLIGGPGAGRVLDIMHGSRIALPMHNDAGGFDFYEYAIQLHYWWRYPFFVGIGESVATDAEINDAIQTALDKGLLCTS